MTYARSLSLLVGIAYFGFVLIGAIAGSGGVLLPSQISDYQVNKSIIGLLFLGSSFGYFLSSTNADMFSQKLGAFRYLTFGAAILFAGNLLVSLRPSFLVLIILEPALGFGAGSMYSSGPRNWISSCSHLLPSPLASSV